MLGKGLASLVPYLDATFSATGYGGNRGGYPVRAQERTQERTAEHIAAIAKGADIVLLVDALFGKVVVKGAPAQEPSIFRFCGWCWPPGVWTYFLVSSCGGRGGGWPAGVVPCACSCGRVGLRVLGLVFVLRVARCALRVVGASLAVFGLLLYGICPCFQIFRFFRQCGGTPA